MLAVLHHAEHPNAIMRLNPLHFAFAGIYHQAVLGLLEPGEYGGRLCGEVDHLCHVRADYSLMFHDHTET